MTQAHLDDEQLSALLDEPGAGSSSHLRGCEACARRLDDLWQVSAAVAEPVASLPPERLDQLVATAIDAGSDAARAAGVWSIDEARARRRRRPRLVPPLPALAAVAVVLALLAAVPALMGLGGTDDGDEASTFASGAPKVAEMRATEADESAESAAGDATAGGGEAFAAGATLAPELVDLGAHDDFASLAAAVRPQLGGGPAPGAEAEDGAVAESAVLPCEPEARAALEREAPGGVAADRRLVLAGRTVWKGQDAVALTFAAGDGAYVITVLTEGSCSLLASGRL